MQPHIFLQPPENSSIHLDATMTVDLFGCKDAGVIIKVMEDFVPQRRRCLRRTWGGTRQGQRLM